MLVYKNKKSGKYSIYIEYPLERTAFVITPAARRIPFEPTLYEPDEEDIPKDELLESGEITVAMIKEKELFIKSWAESKIEDLTPAQASRLLERLQTTNNAESAP